MRRVSVVGGSGSGKTTTGRAIADRLGVPFVETDALHWTHPGWELPPLDEFRARVDEATRGDAWVVDGSYGKVRDLVWSRADTVVWLDPPFPLMLWRTLRRTLSRIGSEDLLWGTQRETWRAAFFSGDSLLLYMIRTHARRARLYGEWLGRYPHLELIHLRGRRDVDRWLASLGARLARPRGEAGDDIP